MGTGVIGDNVQPTHRHFTAAGIRILWCRLAHQNARVLGPKWGAVAQCARCGRQWRTPWAVAVQATPRGHLLPLFDHQHKPAGKGGGVDEDGGGGGGGVLWETGVGVAAFVVAGVVVGVLMAGGVVGGLLAWLMRREWREGWNDLYTRKMLRKEWRRRVRNVLMLGLGGNGGCR